LKTRLTLVFRGDQAHAVAGSESIKEIPVYSDMFSHRTIFAPNHMIPDKMAKNALQWHKGDWQWATF